MTWRYQITRERGTFPNEYSYTIREVFVDSDGQVSWTRDPILPSGENREDLIWILRHMLQDAEAHATLDVTPLGEG